MWGIAEINYMNAREVERGRELAREKYPIQVISHREDIPPSLQPLRKLVALLRQPSPPALDQLLQILRPPEGLGDFVELIREFLPEREADIMAEPDIDTRLSMFLVDFSDKYFPLNTDFIEMEENPDYSIVTDRCPALFQPFTQYDYAQIAEVQSEPALQVIAYIVENPWGEEDRPAFAEAASKHIPENLLKMIPVEGFQIKDLQEWLKDTPFEPVAFWGLIIHQDTGNYFFDNSSLEESGVEYQVAWNRPTVDALTREWQAWEDWQGRWSEFLDCFGKDLEKNSYELIKLLRERRGESGKGEDEEAEEEGTYTPIDPRQGNFFNSVTDRHPGNPNQG